MSVSAGQLVQHAGPGASTETQLSLGRLCALHFSGELFMRHRRAFGISMFLEDAHHDSFENHDQRGLWSRFFSIA